MNLLELREQAAALPRYQGITPYDAADLPEPFRQVVQKLIRAGSMTAGQLALEFGLEPDEGVEIGEMLVAAGLLQSDDAAQPEDSPIYRIYYARTRRQSFSFDL